MIFRVNFYDPPTVVLPEELAGKFFTDVVNEQMAWTDEEVAAFQQETRFSKHKQVTCGFYPWPDEEAFPEEVLVGYPENLEIYVPEEKCTNKK